MKKINKVIKKNRRKNKLPNDIKVCPFQSTPEREIACTPRCALFRSAKQKGYECPLSEITSISWIARQLFDNNNKYKK